MSIRDELKYSANFDENLASLTALQLLRFAFASDVNLKSPPCY